MTILSNEVSNVAYYANLILAAILIVACLIAAAIGYAGISYGDIVAGLVVMLVAIAGLALFSWCFYGIKNDGPDVHIKAIVTDWNEVHDAGYEVLDREGMIYTLMEVRD